MNTPRHKIVFMGTPAFALPSLKGLIESPDFDVVAVITQPDKPLGRSSIHQPSPVKKLALEHNIPALTPEKVKKNTDLLDKLRMLAPEVIVVAAYGKILPQELLDIPPKGVINVHASLLPKHRGASPIAGSILAGELETGVTIMKLVLEMDAGPIIATSKHISITSHDTAGELTAELAEVGAKTLLESLPKYLAGEIMPQEQDSTKATYVKLISKDDGKIDWNEPAETIARKVRAYNPWPSAFTYFNNQPLKILKAEVSSDIAKPSGMVGQTPDNYPVVGTSTGGLKLLMVQLSGKKPTTGKDFLRGYPSLVDSILS
ncbi:methionyl-tRNA formyltransferase [candidate division Kazan bacterium RBG_13_50_9]|uniref:Methionyl-tRNA formyltransferase n=1 Tax=candidate division Kazan bacterium RBG_13_50_9 TaxID=1798535 RepID=A0A1F4NRK7_UNCK3|nr:MAG: methionyl-tRNA formyltransferase [candidate division Kazan bacterium RBG_13_50_9]